ncbi:uncharacterized protein LOC135824201 [Sycon ciliatum]|uniref:uncharacterized protein LOC135824201 n=1 Tax=Sycon ciliatum TaxID=27933 RepID=UPI0031F6BB22
MALWISSEVEDYLPSSQSAYRRDRATTDVVFTLRILSGIAETKQWSLYRLGIDLSKAFDTPHRSDLLSTVVSVAPTTPDVLPLVHTLLSDTTLQVRVQGKTAPPFRSNVGTPQGDSLSPILCTCYFESALRGIRSDSPPDDILPPELQYADDLDFIGTDEQELEDVHDQCAETLPSHNLTVKSSKTERTKMYLADDLEERGSEARRNAKSLGSRLGSAQDVQARKALATQAFCSLYALFKHQSTSLLLRAAPYKTCVKPVLLYNCPTFGLTDATTRRIDTFHRRNLRTMAGAKFPNTITDKHLYDICGSAPISLEIDQRRWEFLGTVLRMQKSSPPQRVLEFSATASLRGRLGRPRTTLLFSGLPSPTRRSPGHA